MLAEPVAPLTNCAKPIAAAVALAEPAVVAVLAKYTESDERLAGLAYESMVPIWSTVKVPRVTREAVVNLKLPMKQRYAEVRRLLERIEEGFKARGVRVSIGCKQLYHDREEVTCHLRRLDIKRAS